MTTSLEAFVLVQQKQIEKLKTRIERQNKEIETEMEMEEDDFMFKKCFNCHIYVSGWKRKFCDFCDYRCCEDCIVLPYECRQCDIDWCGQCVHALANYQAQHKWQEGKFCERCKQFVGVE